MRYFTWDDYYYRHDGTLVFEIVASGNRLYDRLILIHAMVEQLITETESVTEPEITKFDLEHPDSEEPGDELDAPYRNAHCVAEGIERILCGYLNIPWKTYEEGV